MMLSSWVPELITFLLFKSFPAEKQCVDLFCASLSGQELPPGVGHPDLAGLEGLLQGWSCMLCVGLHHYWNGSLETPRAVGREGGRGASQAAPAASVAFPPVLRLQSSPHSRMSWSLRFRLPLCHVLGSWSTTKFSRTLDYTLILLEIQGKKNSTF